jgi:N6-L-threonylcarbamoyladenine synthase
MNTAKALSLAWEIPFISVNHVHAHVYAAMMNKAPPRFPALGLVISGGHTLLLFMKSELDYEVIGTTIDDAVGEAFDKVATVLGLPYPGGPEIEKLAKKGNLDRFPLKPCVVKNSKTNFSFSGLKTRVLYEAKGKNSQKNAPLLINDQEKADLAAAFQHAALTDLVKKSYSACLQHDCSDLYVGGGVSNNRYLKKLFEKYKDSKINIHFPIPELTIDNGAMIAGLGSHLFNRQQRGESFDSFVEPTGKIHL